MTPSLRRAINDKCKDCLYDPLQSGTWREQIEACTSGNCPLFPVRPLSKGRTQRTLSSSKTGPSRGHDEPNFEGVRV